MYRDLTWFESQLGEIYLDTLKMIHKQKNIPEAIEQAYCHLIADEALLKTIDSAGCKRLVNSWLSNKRPNGKSTLGTKQQQTIDTAKAVAELYGDVLGKGQAG